MSWCSAISIEDRTPSFNLSGMAVGVSIPIAAIACVAGGDSHEKIAILVVACLLGFIVSNLMGSIQGRKHTSVRVKEKNGSNVGSNNHPIANPRKVE